MPTRRDFLGYAGVAGLAGCLPLDASPARLPARRIPGTDEFLPVVGLGNSRTFREKDLDPARALVDILLDHGGAYVDCGGPSRFSVARIVGERNAHDDTFLGMYFDGRTEAAARAEIGALVDLQGSRSVDLVQSRSIEDLAPARGNSLFHRLKSEGLARYVGYARSQQRFYPPMLRLMKSKSVDFIQVNYSMLEREAEERVLPTAIDEGIAIVVNRPFINGRYFSIVEGHELPAWASEFDCRSWAQFSLKFILSHPAVSCVLTETSNPKHAVDNLGAGFGRLPDEETRRRMLAHMLEIV